VGSGIEGLLASLRADPGFMAQVENWRTVAARGPALEPFPPGLHPGVAAALRGRGIEALYGHQARAFELAAAGRHVVVVTPTASGKTLCYNLPVLDRLAREPTARALYVFPTKALSQDQVAELLALSEARAGPASGLKTYTYDGDTPPEVRRRLREDGHVIVTNPYMLHAGILPNHPRWVHLFQGLRFVVIDELHAYRGVFGSHVANVLRRLRRVCRHYGASPTFVLASATIGNPRELAERLVEAEVKVVDRNGAPQGERHYVFVNPPVVQRPLGIRRAAVEEVRRLARRLLPFEARMIVFGRSRNQVEVLLKYLKDAARETGVDPGRVRGYRGGYLPRLRREIEAGLRSGDVLAVVATNALELGVDIGSLDVAILCGYPGSTASFFQQAGRAGRRTRPSLAVLVGRSTPLDQYLLRHPEHLLDRPREATVVDPDNLLIKVNHVKCSAFEAPFRRGETYGGTLPPALSRGEREGAEAPAVGALEGGPRADETAQILDYLAEDARVLVRAGDAYHWMAEAYPADGVSLTAADIDAFVVFDAEARRAIGEVDRPSAMTELHEGAIYGFEGEQYVVERLDYENRRAEVRRVACDYYTEAEAERSVKVLEIDGEEDHGAYVVRTGEVEMTTVATVFKKIRFYTRENVGAGEIRLPPEKVLTTATWLSIDPAVAAAHGLFAQAAGALVALRNLLKHVVPLFVRCDPGDIHVLAETRSAVFGGRPTLYVVDHMPAGTGLAERTFRAEGEVLGTMREVLGECACDLGCPSCAGTVEEVGLHGKRAAAALLQALSEGSEGGEGRTGFLATETTETTEERR